MPGRRTLAAALSLLAALLGGAGSAVLGVCGPFTDVSDATFCPFVQEIFILGITTGTTPTTYDPGSPVSRLQMAAFLSRTVDRALQRSGRRAALRQFWTTQSDQIPLTTTIGGAPRFVEFDGADLWVPHGENDRVSRIRASDGKVLETWTGAADFATAVLVAMGRVFIASRRLPTGVLYRIDPSLPAGAVTMVASDLPSGVLTIAFDGGRIWTASVDGSVSIVTPGVSLPWTVTTVSGFETPAGILYDGANIWITDSHNPGRPDQTVNAGTLLKLDASGGVLQTVTLGQNSGHPVFDGTNIWVPNSSAASVSVVRASSGAVLATLTGNGLIGPVQAAFDGQRVLVTSIDNSTVSLWKAADLTPLGFSAMPPGSGPFGACSDGANFWVSLFFGQKLARF